MRGDGGQQPLTESATASAAAREAAASVAVAAAVAPAPGGGRGRDEVVLVLAPTGRDMPLACALLTDRAGVQCESCTDIVDLCTKIRGCWPSGGAGGAESKAERSNSAGGATGGTRAPARLTAPAAPLP